MFRKIRQEKTEVGLMDCLDITVAQISRIHTQAAQAHAESEDHVA